MSAATVLLAEKDAEIARLRRLLVELAILAEPYAGPQGPDNQIDLADFLSFRSVIGR